MYWQFASSPSKSTCGCRWAAIDSAAMMDKESSSCRTLPASPHSAAKLSNLVLLLAERLSTLKAATSCWSVGVDGLGLGGGLGRRWRWGRSEVSRLLFLQNAEGFQLLRCQSLILVGFIQLAS